ncbi:MAG TPA: carboxypeptidase regulatory-like domain-containing protein [Longimicrobiaceae bacterium]|nr:carboxypeptidase regulatory-like domain-containing protein [Longimicrobiaceae bacterium]
MNTTPRGATLLLAALLSAVPLPGAAQDAGPTLRGTVRAADSGEPLPFAVVELPGLDRRVIASAAGGFEFTGVPAGRHRLVVEQVGYATVDTLAWPDHGAVRIGLRPAPVDLDDLAAARPGRCATAGLADAGTTPQLARLMAELRRNAEHHRLLEDRYPVRFRYLRIVGPAKQGARTATDTVVEHTRDRRPYRVGGGVPSLADVADPAFQEGHCFRFAGTDPVEGEPLHRIDFAALPAAGAPGLEGSLFLDPRTLLVRRTVFRAVGEPRGFLLSVATEVVTTYREVPPGLVVPVARRVVTTPRGLGSLAVGGASARTFRLLGFEFTGAHPGTEP